MTYDSYKIIHNVKCLDALNVEVGLRDIQPK